MASTVELPLKSTRRMDEAEVRAESARFGVPHDADVEVMRRNLKTVLEQHWLRDNRENILAMNAWVEKNGLPLEKFRLW